MKPIRILSPTFDLLGEIDDYESLQFTRRWQRPGEIELHINVNKNNTEALLEDNIIMLGAEPRKVAIIRHREIKLDEHGKATEELLIKGQTLQSITNRRVTVPPAGLGYDRIKDNAESVMKHYIDAHCINPTDVKRKIPQLTLAPDLKRGIYVPWQSRFEQLDAVLQEIAEFTGIGWEIYLDLVNKAWIFDIVEGRDLTTAQAVNIPVIFSVEFDNIKGQHYTDSALNLKTVGYAGGQGEEELRLIQQIGDAEGLGRLETFLDCSDAADADELLANGQQKLAELKQAQSFEVNISPSGSFIYGTDWDLGDLVTVRSSKWGITMHSRITEVKEIYESSGFNLEATFGNSIPTIVDKIKQSFKQNSIPIRR